MIPEAPRKVPQNSPLSFCFPIPRTSPFVLWFETLTSRYHSRSSYFGPSASHMVSNIGSHAAPLRTASLEREKKQKTPASEYGVIG
jgi:hypothetical protein